MRPGRRSGSWARGRVRSGNRTTTRAPSTRDGTSPGCSQSSAGSKCTTTIGHARAVTARSVSASTAGDAPNRPRATTTPPRHRRVTGCMPHDGTERIFSRDARVSQGLSRSMSASALAWALASSMSCPAPSTTRRVAPAMPSRSASAWWSGNSSSRAPCTIHVGHRMSRGSPRAMATSGRRARAAHPVEPLPRHARDAPFVGARAVVAALDQAMQLDSTVAVGLALHAVKHGADGEQVVVPDAGSGVVMSSDSERTRSGARAASRCAIAPPMEIPAGWRVEAVGVEHPRTSSAMSSSVWLVRRPERLPRLAVVEQQHTLPRVCARQARDELGGRSNALLYAPGRITMGTPVRPATCSKEASARTKLSPPCRKSADRPRPRRPARPRAPAARFLYRRRWCRSCDRSPCGRSTSPPCNRVNSTVSSLNRSISLVAARGD